jgi:hypothetical protein
MFKGDKYSELMKGVMPPKIIRAHRNRNFPLIYPTGLINKDFALSLTFNSAPILTDLRILSDAFLSRRSHNNALVTYDMQSFFQLNRNNATQWVQH